MALDKEDASAGIASAYSETCTYRNFLWVLMAKLVAVGTNKSAVLTTVHGHRCPVGVCERLFMLGAQAMMVLFGLVELAGILATDPVVWVFGGGPHRAKRDIVGWDRNWVEKKE